MGQGVLNNSRVDLLLADAGISRDRRGSLLSSDAALADIVAEVGTPAFIYNTDVIRTRYQNLASALAEVPHLICYAVKANSNLAVLKLLADCGAGADIVSGGELNRVLAVGFDPQRIVFSGVGKTNEELQAALEAGVGQINAESVEELVNLASLTERLGRSANVGIRINPDIVADTHPYIATGVGGLKFGIPIDRLPRALEIIAAAPSLNLTGLAVHLGSQLLSTDPYRAALAKLLGIVDSLSATQRGSLRSLDLGGGMGIRYRGDEATITPDELAAVVIPPMRDTGLQLKIEPGRYLVGSAGLLITKVLLTKESGGRRIVVVDAAMNDLIRPSFYDAYHAIVPVESLESSHSVVDIVGPVCETGDFLARSRDLPPVEDGSLLAVLGAGAYAFSMSSQYNSRCRAAEVMVRGGEWRIVRRRESFEDLIRGETADPFRGEW